MRRVMLTCACVALLYQVDLPPWRRDAASGLLLEGMEHVQHAVQLHGVHDSIRVPVEVLDEFDQATQLSF